MPGRLSPALLSVIACLSEGLRIQDDDQKPAPPKKAVPFYMYELPDWVKKCQKHRLFNQNLYPDVAFSEVLQDHPWRVANASKAELFVVPGYLSASQAGACGNHSENMQELASMLGASAHFRRSKGRDHVISGFSWQVSTRTVGALREPMEADMIVLRYERRSTRTRKYHFKREVVVPYGPVGASGETVAAVDPAEREHSLFFVGQADSRWTYRTRRRALHTLPAVWNDSVLVKTPLIPGKKRGNTKKNTWDDPESLKEGLPACERPVRLAGCTMEAGRQTYLELGSRSNYSLVIHGDTPSTSRLYDALMLEQVPVIIAEHFREWATPFPDDLPWDDIAVFVDQDAFAQDAVGALREAMSRTPFATTLERWRSARPALDWSLGSHCIGSAVLLDAARRHLGVKGLPRAVHTPECRPQKAVAGLARFDGGGLQADVDSALLQEELMDGRFD